MKKPVSLLLLFLCTLPATAAARQFDIELIVFKRLVNPDQVEESWPGELPAIDFTDVGSLDDHDYRKRKRVSVRSRSSYQLTGMADKLQQHAGYEVLLHQVWRQGDRGPSSAPKFRLQAGKNYTNQYNPDGSQKVSVVNNDGNDPQEEVPEQLLYELDGKIQIYVQHYLFLETTLDLNIPGNHEIILTDQQLDLADTESGDTVQVGNLTQVSPAIQQEHFLKSYRMMQKRRMKSGELHYLDHPLMGIIVQVRRL